MPDFDKDLNPIIKREESTTLESYVESIKPCDLSAARANDYAGETDVFGELSVLSKKSYTDILRPFVTSATYNPIIGNQEDFATNGQSTIEKGINGILNT